MFISTYVSPFNYTYRIAGFFEVENFHEFHESIAIRENITLEIFTKSIRHCVLLMRFVKIFPLKKNPLYGNSIILII